MYALINTMDAAGYDSIGTILSCHRSVEAAERADRALQRAVKRANGSASYLPTIVVELLRRPRGSYVAQVDARAIDEE